jgi:ribosomal protein S18 acetylase RimI-like enzyme
MISIRPTLAQDTAAILQMAASEPLFTPEEADTVRELLSDYLEKPDHNGYFFLTAEFEGQLAGFACYGPTSLTKGTFDLYWICVDRRFARRGVGKALIDRAEDEVQHAGGRMVVVETSGLPEYAPTRAFYEGIGYTRVATIPDYYAPGNDLVIYIRPFKPGRS